jgi:hypothetical protein
VLILVAVKVRRDGAAALRHGFDHRVGTLRNAAVDPDGLALAVGTLQPNITATV